MTGNFGIAFLMCALAGMSTGIGSLAFLLKKDNREFLAASLGFAAGVMVYVSFIEIFHKALQNLTEAHGSNKGWVLTVISFFAGIAFVIAVNLIFSALEKRSKRGEVDTNFNANRDVSTIAAELADEKLAAPRLIRSGLLTAIAMAIHNFPEGLATFISAYSDPSFAITVVVAIAIHNIPEGIAVSVPIYYATKSKIKAFLISFASGLAELAGAMIGFFLIGIISASLYGVLFAAVAGMMVWLSVGELLPTGREYSAKYCSGGFIAGMLTIAISLLLFM